MRRSMTSGATCTCKSYAPWRHFQAASETGVAFAPAAPSPVLGDVAVISCFPFQSDLLSGGLGRRRESSPGKMAYPFEWIPEFGNHPEKVAGKEYTLSLGGFTRGCGGLSGTGFTACGKTQIFVIP